MRSTLAVLLLFLGLLLASTYAQTPGPPQTSQPSEPAPSQGTQPSQPGGQPGSMSGAPGEPRQAPGAPTEPGGQTYGSVTNQNSPGFTPREAPGHNWGWLGLFGLAGLLGLRHTHRERAVVTPR